MKYSKKVLIPAILSTSLISFHASASDNWQGDARDAWIDGKLETSYLLNTELNNFTIDTAVEAGEVTLSGVVKSETHKELAELIAENISGVEAVHNDLTVGDVKSQEDPNKRKLNIVFNDLTTSARLKSEYIINEQIDAADISIDTFKGVVTLEGKVDSEAEKMLAEQIAYSFSYVEKVENKLEVESA